MYRLKLALSRPSVCGCVRPFAQSKIMTLKKIYPKVQCTQSPSRSLSLIFDHCNRQKSTKTLAKLSLKLFANSQRERGDAICVCALGVPHTMRRRRCRSLQPVVRCLSTRKSLNVSHLENRLNILSIWGNKNKFFTFRDLISCFCCERVDAVAFVCVATEIGLEFCSEVCHFGCLPHFLSCVPPPPLRFILLF